MATTFRPRLDILPPAQRRLWDELAAVPADFVLYGGTALALHLGHRQSEDFDFFADRDIDPAEVYLPTLPSDVKDRLMQAASTVDPLRLPSLGRPTARRRSRKQGRKK